MAVVARAEVLPFGAATFDGAWADRTFHHLIDPELAFADMLRVTRSGGRVVVVDPDYDTQVIDVDDQDLLAGFSDSEPTIYCAMGHWPTDCRARSSPPDSSTCRSRR